MKIHFRRFRRLQRASASALRMFTRTQKKLERQNEKLRAVIAEMETEAAQLLHLSSAAKAHHDANAQVLTNINAIVADHPATEAK